MLKIPLQIWSRVSRSFPCGWNCRRGPVTSMMRSCFELFYLDFVFCQEFSKFRREKPFQAINMSLWRKIELSCRTDFRNVCEADREELCSLLINVRLRTIFSAWLSHWLVRLCWSAVYRRLDLLTCQRNFLPPSSRRWVICLWTDGGKCNSTVHWERK